jgi:hypothetical protein
MTIASTAPAQPRQIDDGNNQLSGTISLAGTPDTLSPNTRVVLLRNALQHVVVSESQSDDEGSYRIDGIRHGTQYTLIAYDPTDALDPACRANLIPSPMPPNPLEHA